jgi:hypothetical protein
MIRPHLREGRIPFHPMFERDQFRVSFNGGIGVTLLPAMVAREASGGRPLSLEQETFRRVGYIRVRRHAAGVAQNTFVKVAEAGV